jgi:internalin A
MQDPALTATQQMAYDKALEKIETCRLGLKGILNLSGLGLSSLPPEIGQLTALTQLHLSSNELISLPPEIGQLTALTQLVVWGNQLSSLPPTICELTALTVLDLMGNQLSSLPPAIGELTALTVLDLMGNQLSSLPPEIGQLTALTVLDLMSNQLSSLPPEIGQITALTHLEISQNQLSSLPPEIGQLMALTVLDLAGNQLSSLPAWLKNLPKLERLFLHNNPALKLSPSVLGSDPRKTDKGWATAKSILDFYFGRQQGKTRPLNEVKLILVGRGGAGKTSTVQALQGLAFNESEESTPGIALCDWTMAGCKKGPVTAHVWDFAGQVITHALHQFFFSVRSVYVVVLTGRENNERDDAEYWLRLIKAFGTDEQGNGPPVIVALNKWDKPGCRPQVDRGALQERYPFIRSFVEVDCKTDKGVAKLKGALCREVDRLPWVREPFPAAWDAVRRALSTGRKKRAHLTYAEYRALCATHGVQDEGQQDSLAEILHNLGAALNYRNDPRLREATVLQPEWLTKNVYALVRRAEKKAGVLTQADVDVVLRREKDAAMRAYLLQIMERFEIAYAPRASDEAWRPLAGAAGTAGQTAARRDGLPRRH